MRTLAMCAALALAAGCDPRTPDGSETSRMLGFTPSNVELDVTMFDGVGDVVMDSDSECVISALEPGRLGCGTDRSTYRVFDASNEDGTPVTLVTLRSLQLTAETVVRVGGDVPLVIVALDRIDIEGDLVVDYGKAGGAPSTGSSPDGVGPGGGLPSPITPQNGTGGSFCGRGGPSGDGTGAPEPVGNLFNVPLIGGSSGGGRFAGAGGGAIQLVAGDEIRIVGTLAAPGQGEDNVDAGGGSGGAVLVESQSVVLAGTISANGGGGASEDKRDGTDGPLGEGRAEGGTSDGGAEGGAGGGQSAPDGDPGGPRTRDNLGGGSGGGGAGRIRISVLDDRFDGATGALSPGLDTLCAVVGAVTPALGEE